MKISRRGFIAGGGAVLLAGCARRSPSKYPGVLHDASALRGHLIREARSLPVHERVHADALIVGGGIAGLTVRRELARGGLQGSLLLELEDSVGGNSSWGENAVSKFPWGAHYVPPPGTDAQEVRALFQEFGVLSGYDSAGEPIYKEEYLCFEPAERLFIHGDWQEGIVPQRGVSESELGEMTRFHDLMSDFAGRRGGDGKRAFAIPVERSSRDPEFLAFDNVPFSHFLDERNFRGEHLRWYLDYCCRDDFGAGVDAVSAWAGIHYFAARETGKGEGPVLVWPEGNGWLAARIRDSGMGEIRTGMVVCSIREASDGVTVTSFDVNRSRVIEFSSPRLAYCAPRYTAPYVMPDVVGRGDVAALQYDPWMVANLTLSELPLDSSMGVAWDNVLFRSRSLGYVSATHQRLSQIATPTVWTYFLPLDHLDPSHARAEASSKSLGSWQEDVVRDLSRVHRDIEPKIRAIDVRVWGHGMIRPAPGFRSWARGMRNFSGTRRIRFAHSDMSGISIFEEAYGRGVIAARELLAI